VLQVRVAALIETARLPATSFAGTAALTADATPHPAGTSLIEDGRFSQSGSLAIPRCQAAEGRRLAKSRGDDPVHRLNARENALVSAKPRRNAISVTERRPSVR
jgi:hypothetical protein